MSGTLVLMIVMAVLLLLLVVLVVAAVSGYNRLVRLRAQVQASWAQVDVQLKRRHSLIPNLVETVKGYAGHERATLEAVTAARAAAAGTRGGGADRVAAEGALTQALGGLFALAEAYPQLRASENFAELQRELSATEDKIAYARQFYNSAVQSLNTAVQTLPTNVIAGLGGFRVEAYFEAVGVERADLSVRF
ncbi:LemA family protein [Micromonospora sp. WMMD812]|uniref:LemA family protein n=1 Tax=Micromonospora sp. WMMD812 TaxID=3015152 RepID=UPI00248BA4C4|nr:LemA family protein [Micromonospora sp. WMMD812]WBB68431.1 LemA family protein [Micromonospora sp. WMMD812]